MSKTFVAVLLLAPMTAWLDGCQRETTPPPAASVPATAASAAPGAALPASAAAPGKAMPAPPEVRAGDDVHALAQRSGCFACHAIDKKLVGPAWSEVAAKYRGQKDAEQKLVTKVARGGSGVWGATPMPPNEPRVSEEDIRTLVRFILSLK